jgi:flavin reductase (DIM6/NTAB) family NADH-FMN oxidoreductase RutF
VLQEVDLSRAYRATVTGLFLITTCRDGKPNVQFAFRGLGIMDNPPLVLVGIQHSNYSHETIELTREFVVNVCSEQQVAAIPKGRTLSAKSSKVDKFAELGFETRPATKVAAPLVLGCHANLECRVRDALPTEGVTLYLADVLACHVDDALEPVLRFQGKTFRIGEQLDGPRPA